MDASVSKRKMEVNDDEVIFAEFDCTLSAKVCLVCLCQFFHFTNIDSLYLSLS